MNAGSLFVSFWHISLANLPEGNFTHRPVAPEEAQRYISQARSAATLHGVSGDDLIAPFRKRKRQEHDELCGVLKEHFGIELSLKDFCSQYEEDGKPLSHIQPLVTARVEDENRLLIVTCDYALGKQSERRRTQRRSGRWSSLFSETGSSLSGACCSTRFRMRTGRFPGIRT